MEDRERPSLFARLVIPLFLFFGGIAAFWGFGIFLYGLLVDLSAGSESVCFSKGGFYMLGVGLILAIGSVAVGYECWSDKTISMRWNRRLTKILLASAAIMLLFPHLTHFAVNTHLKNEGYTVCREASKQWLFVRTIVYTRNDEVCRAMAEEAAVIR